MAKVWSVEGRSAWEGGGHRWGVDSPPSSRGRLQGASSWVPGRGLAELDIQLTRQRNEGLSTTQYQTGSLVSCMGSCVSELLEGTWMVHLLCVVSEPLFCLGDTEGVAPVCLF